MANRSSLHCPTAGVGTRREVRHRRPRAVLHVERTRPPLGRLAPPNRLATRAAQLDGCPGVDRDTAEHAALGHRPSALAVFSKAATAESLSCSRASKYWSTASLPAWSISPSA